MHLKHEPQQKLKKDLSIPGMLRGVRRAFLRMVGLGIPPDNSVRDIGVRIEGEDSDEKAVKCKERGMTIVDYLMASQAMFFLKCASLLDFDKKRPDETVVANLKTLFEVERIPSDTSMRERLDPVSPKVVEAGFEELYEIAQRNGVIKHMREGTLENTAYVAVDGTRYFTSKTLQCDSCCCREKEGKKEYSHGLLAAAIVNPAISQVIPLCPEQILKQDGTEKNDCEQNAFKRWLKAYARKHPHLPTTFLLDGLYGVTPVVQSIMGQNDFFVISLKDDERRIVLQEKEALEPDGEIFVEAWPNKLYKTEVSPNEIERASILAGEISRFNGRPIPKASGMECIRIRWWHRLPLTGDTNSPLVTVVEAIVHPIVWPRAKASQPRPNPHLGEPTKFQWITNHEVNMETALSVVRAGRSRWKIENENFNALKNCGYELEHNYGHGKKNLATIFALQIILSFAIEQLAALACGVYQAVIKVCRTFYERMQSQLEIFTRILLPNWEIYFGILTREISLTFGDQGIKASVPP
jgi:hypothetical protein